MNFDRIAPFYELIEFFCAGGSLQRCRTEFLGELESPREVLVLGEGNGRFLTAFLARFPDASVTCVEGSEEMIRLAEERLNRNGQALCRVRFVQQDITTWVPETGRFDLLVVHFFLDCFERAEVGEIVGKLRLAAGARGTLLLSDFQKPAGRVGKTFAEILLWGLYHFFAMTAGVRAREIVPPDEILQTAGFRMDEKRLSVFGVLAAGRWRLS